MKLFLPIAMLAATVTRAQENVSPLFLFSSTASLDLTSLSDDSCAKDVYYAFAGAVSSCPTKNYAVVIQPGVSVTDYDSSYLPIGVHAHTNLIVEKIRGDVDVVAVVNTILMDCLHAKDGVTRVESLDTGKLKVSQLSEEVVKKSIMHIALPGISPRLGTTERVAVLAKHDAYLKNVVSTYFDNSDYTLIYITKALMDAEEGGMEDAKDESRTLEGAEIPFVLGDEE